MDRIITFENLRQFAYLNNNICKKPYRGVVVSFFALGASEVYETDTREGSRLGAEGLLVINPYTNPWAWMNMQSVALTDEILDVVFDSLRLDPSLPVVACGPSMGGYASLIYSAYGKRKLDGCVANCPVCDLTYQYSSRFTDARTMYSAYGSYEGTMDEALKAQSPLYITSLMPKETGYYIFHCGDDSAVNIEKNSIPFYEKMKADHNIHLTIVPGRDHLNLTDEAWGEYERAIKSFFDKT